MKSVVLALFVVLSLLFRGSSEKPNAANHNRGGPVAIPPSASPTITVVGQSAGPTPFIANLQLIASDPTAVKSVGFTITPKPGSVTRPVSVTCTADYLQSRGYFNLQT